MEVSILGNHDYGDYVDWDSEGRKRTDLKDFKTTDRKEIGLIAFKMIVDIEQGER